MSPLKDAFADCWFGEDLVELELGKRRSKRPQKAAFSRLKRLAGSIHSSGFSGTLPKTVSQIPRRPLRRRLYP